MLTSRRGRLKSAGKTCCAIIGAIAVAISIPGTMLAGQLETSDGPVEVRSWGYQLQGSPPSGELRLRELTDAPFDLLVIDYARSGVDETAHSQEEIRELKRRRSDGKSRVLASYLSIGEASEFRTYWQAGWTRDGLAKAPLTDSAPSWLGPINPDWPESRKVRYWDQDWRSKLSNDRHTGQLDLIVRQGFDAAYLDIVDAYYFWGEELSAQKKKAGDPADAQDAARRMIDLITWLCERARRENPAFFMIVQNGAFLLSDSDHAGPKPEDPFRRRAFLNAVDAIAVEDLYFPGDQEIDNPMRPDRESIRILKKDFAAEGKPVFVVEYLKNASNKLRFRDAALSDGFIPYVAPSRDLDRLGPPLFD